MPNMITVRVRGGYEYKGHKGGSVICIPRPEYTGLKHLFEIPPKSESIQKSVRDRSMKSPTNSNRMKRK